MVVGMCPWSSGTLPAEQFISPPADAWPRIAAANEVPEAVPSPELAKELVEAQGKEATKLTIEE